MGAVDYEAEYNNRVRVPEHPTIMTGWARDAAAYRQAHPPQALRYGESARHTIDLFSGRGVGDAATVMFIHGGYWQALDASHFSHLAAGLNAHGIDVAIPSYDLCPTVSVADIIAQMQAACRVLASDGRRLVVSGHSAGGHLAACLMATDWRALGPTPPNGFIRAGYAISGLFDLSPLIATSINTALKLNQDSARHASPMWWTPAIGSVFDAVLGGDESSEYFRQSRAFVEQWSAMGAVTQFGTVPAANHFTVLAPLTDRESAMVARLAAMARL
ncbi:MAG: alpha/beta hydrolase [Tardiphaga sp.]|nr:alpha/beta hydrolase [Tardiphaga sp.]